MEQDNQGLLCRLRKPAGPVDVVLDTDTYNEIDDQFALAFLIKSEEKLNLKGIYAAPFFNRNSSSPADGMEKSYNEIFNVLALMKREDLKPLVKRGSAAYLPSEKEAVDSEAARSLADLAVRYAEDKPLYVIAIGAITNVASAILLRPEIVNRIVIVWLGGQALDWPDNKEFNLFQDVAAARIIFGCGAALVQLPCMGVVSAFASSGPELEHWLRGKNALCDYLVDYTAKSALKDGGLPNWTRPIWDVTAVGWLLDGDFMLDRLEHSPIPQYDHHYSFDHRRHFIRYVYHINRDRLFEELFRKLAK
jgi:inosine-uridine nucleoside N-ribohydrolase